MSGKGIQNVTKHEQPLIYKLPNELYILIADFLDPDKRLILRLVSKRFREALGFNDYWIKLKTYLYTYTNLTEKIDLKALESVDCKKLINSHEKLFDSLTSKTMTSFFRDPKENFKEAIELGYDILIKKSS